MRINDIINEFEKGADVDVIDKAIQNWRRTSARYYDSEITSRVPAMAKQIYNAGGVSPADAISQAIENAKSSQNRDSTKQSSTKGFSSANMKRPSDQDRVSSSGKRWGNQYYYDQDKTKTPKARTPGALSTKLKSKIDQFKIDTSTVDSAAGTGFDTGKNIGSALSNFMDKYTKSSKNRRR